MIRKPFLKCFPIFLTILVAASSCFADDLNQEQLIASARAGGDYLLRMQKPDGSFHYTYDALEDRTGSETYNILRHAGTSFALLDLYAKTREPRYLDSANRAIEFLKAQFRPARAPRSSYVLDFDGKAKLGANGLALIALARQLELDPKRGDRAGAERLANLILSLQRKNGSFASYYRIHGKEPEGRVSLYYPGEAMLGVVLLFKSNGDRRLIEAVRRGADHLIAAQRNMDELPPDAWLMQALEGLHRIGKEKRYADHAIALAESMIAAQYTTATKHPGYAGGFGPGRPGATPAASRAEGIVAAYRMARATGDHRETTIGAALKLAVRFMLSQQFDIRDPALTRPALAAGGFRENAISWQVRIDYVQHNISALLGIAEALY